MRIMILSTCPIISNTKNSLQKLSPKDVWKIFRMRLFVKILTLPLGVIRCPWRRNWRSSNYFWKCFWRCCRSSCPLKKTFRVTRPPTPWMTERMKTKMHERDKLRAQYKANFDNETFEKYKELSNTINHEKRKAKIKHFNSNINKQTPNSKRIHHVLKM